MKVIISFTTIPTRINNIKPMIDSLLGQSIKADEIILWIAKSYKRLNSNIKTDIPSFISNSNILVKYCDDLGPFTKLYYSLKQEWENKESVIVTVDDDVYYPKNWLKTLIKSSKKYPKSAIGFRGRILHDKLNYKTSKLFFGAPSRKPLKVDIITGTWGVLYKVEFFSEEIFDQQLIKSNFMVDDIWITGNLAKNKIERIILKNVGVKLFQEIHVIDGLWSINKKSDNNNKLLEYFNGII